MQTIAILEDLGKKGTKIEHLDPQTFEFKVHTSAWVYTYHHDYLGNCGARDPVVLFN